MNFVYEICLWFLKNKGLVITDLIFVECPTRNETPEGAENTKNCKIEYRPYFLFLGSHSSNAFDSIIFLVLN